LTCVDVPRRERGVRAGRVVVAKGPRADVEGGVKVLRSQVVLRGRDVHLRELKLARRHRLLLRVSRVTTAFSEGGESAHRVPLVARRRKKEKKSNFFEFFYIKYNITLLP
jgi:hypothetical protein